MKNILLLSVLSVLAIVCPAQETHFGIKAGINMASVKISNGTDYDTKVGLHLGGLAHIHISKQFAVQPELLYSMQGGESGNVKLQLNYINLPLLAQYMLNNGFRLQTGPQISFLVSAESKVGDVEVDIKDEIAGIDFSWVFGLGYLFSQGIGIDTRFNIGLNNISDIDDFEAHNQVFQVGLFYQFMNKGKRK